MARRKKSPLKKCVAVFVTAYHILSQYTSLHVRTRSSQAVRKLLSLQPAVALVIRNGKEEEVPIEEVHTGDLVRVRPGAQIPVDGEVFEGNSAVNESLVSGEPFPKDKAKGDEVIGGSVNQTGALIVRVTKIGEESFLQQVARHLQEARALKPSIIQLVDRILKYFVPVVLAFAGLAFLIWTFGAWFVTGKPDFIRATFSALAVLVMGYPCALGMATPLAMIRGGGEAAQKGILMRTGEAFQVFKDVKRVILDKTGTITVGKPKVADVIPLNGSSDEDLLQLAASAGEDPQVLCACCVGLCWTGVFDLDLRGLVCYGQTGLHPSYVLGSSSPGHGLSLRSRDGNAVGYDSRRRGGCSERHPHAYW